MKTMTYDQVKKLNPCTIPIEWDGAIDAVEARNRGVSVNGIIWVAAHVVDLRMFAIECAEHVLNDDSPQAAHDACRAARAFLAGEIDGIELRLAAVYAAHAADAADAAYTARAADAEREWQFNKLLEYLK